MIGVRWTITNPQLASSRFRAAIPSRVLKKHGLITEGDEVTIFSKHGWDAAEIKQSKASIMDVCDDHFSHPDLRNHYLQACEFADVVTCNSVEMQKVIFRDTGRKALVIDDPYEDEEREPKEGKGLLWFGFAGNYFDLKPLLPDLLKYELNLVSNHNWSLELLDKYLRECRCVIIPTGRSMAKSANRAIKAIRYGKYPVCGYLPAHEELGLGGEPIIEHLDYAMTNDMSGRIRELQEQIEARFHPETVAKQWYRAIHEAESLQRRKAVP